MRLVYCRELCPQTVLTSSRTHSGRLHCGTPLPGCWTWCRPWPALIAWGDGSDCHQETAYGHSRLGVGSPLHEIHAVLGLHVEDSFRLDELEHLREGGREGVEGGRKGGREGVEGGRREGGGGGREGRREGEPS